MSGVNKCMFVGFVGKDAEERATASGNPVLNFSIAVNEKWTDQNSGEKKERTEWIPFVLFGKRAKALAQYITKGTLLHVEGKWQTRKWQDKEGKDRYSTECIVQDLQLLGGGKNSGTRDRQDDERGSQGGGGGVEQGSDPGPSDDDIPFAVNESSNGIGAMIGERWNRANGRII